MLEQLVEADGDVERGGSCGLMLCTEIARQRAGGDSELADGAFDEVAGRDGFGGD